MDPLNLNEFCDTNDIYEDVCRICLNNDVILNWNDEIPEYIGLTYKECYYKYTQLELLVIDPYSQMLCQTCAEDLKNVHFLILKALESDAILQRTHLTDFQIICIETLKKDIINNQVEDGINVGSDENTVTNIESVEIEVQGKRRPIASNKSEYKENDIFEESVQTFKAMLSPSSTFEQVSNESIIDSEKAISDQTDDDQFDITLPNIKTFNNEETESNKKASEKRKRTPDSVEILTSKNDTGPKYMCSNCSKFYTNRRKLVMHEETHNKNRERSEICSVCGIKCFTKQHLRLHMEIHNELREKKYKCNFCEKAYFSMGALNVHKRIHLGQMVPCPICSKEFHRQIDLDRHYTAAHSEAPLTADLKKQSKYYVYCKDCNKEVRTPTWKEHEATHLKKPLMKCSICHKEFFTRAAVKHHMYKVHNYKTKQEYDQFVIHSKPNRLSHLLLKQKDMLKRNTT